MIFLYNILSSIFRGVGNSKIALFTVGVSCVINIVLDMILVAYLNMGAAGAAIATVLSQAVSVVMSFFVLIKLPMISINKNSFKPRPDIMKKVLQLGVPIAFQGVLVSISFLAIIVIVNKFGVVFSAAIGVVGRIVGFIMLVPISFGQAVSVFVSQNYGAGQHSRAKKGLVLSIAISFAISVVMGYISFFHGEILISIFDSDPELMTPATDYLKSFAIDTLLVSVLFCLTGFFTGYGRTMFTMIQSIVGSIGIRLMFVYLFSLITPPSLFLIGLATPLATTIQIMIGAVYYYFNFSAKCKNRY